jgi:hypothetical protein
MPNPDPHGVSEIAATSIEIWGLNSWQRQSCDTRSLEEKSMNRMAKLLLSIATMMVFALPVLAQTQPAVDNGDQKSSINSRKEEQAKRLEQGVDNGTINKSEQHQIKRNERRMNHEERQMKAANGGSLTSADRAELRRQQKHVSRQITKDSHK